MSSGRRHVLDRWVRRSAGGRLLSGGAPSRMVRLSAAGSDALDQALAGEAEGRSLALAERLRRSGLLHPVPGRGEAQPLTTVIPARDGGAGLAELVAELRAWGEVIVVDDGSVDDSARSAREAGALVIANEGRPGPAGARNAGLARAETEFVAFLDADCVSRTDWPWALAGLLAEEPDLGLVAPRVRALPGAGAIARYETGRSPLDLGGNPSLVGPGRRLGFLPSAALVARRSALLGVGGFDAEMRIGEDVDLVMRLIAAGFAVRYAPQAEVEHRSRPDLAALCRQRFSYAASAPALAHRHPGSVAPLRLDRNLVAVWAATAFGGRRAGAAALFVSVAATAARGSDADARAALALLAARAHLGGARQLARALARDWLPLTALACLSRPRLTPLALLVLAADLLGSRKPGAQRLSPTVAAPLRGLENLAYAAGLWSAAARRRSAAALLPTFSSSTSHQ